MMDWCAAGLGASPRPCFRRIASTRAVVQRRRERVTRQNAIGDHRLITEIESRGLPHRFGAANAAVLLRQVLRVSNGEARSRVANAAAAGARIRDTGEIAPAIYTQVAAAQGEGAISAAHARVVVAAVKSLAPEIQAVHGAALEARVVELARDLDPDQLARHARREAYLLDQDGVLREAAYRERTRDLHLRVRPDGSGSLTGELTAECTEHLRTVLGVLARPVSGAAGERDPRRPGPRLHDGLLELCQLAERAEVLPDAGGVTTTVLLTMTAEAFTTGVGLATTGHGAIIAAATAKAWLAGENRIIGAIFNRAYGIEQITTTARFFTKKQRLLLIARDGGCAFPGCEAPPQRCESHHIVEWDNGGTTSIDNGVLLCRFHHHHFAAMGWHIRMIDGAPHFIPPPWLDPERRPRQNAMLRPERALEPV